MNIILKDGSVKNFQIVYNPYSFQEKGVYFISYQTQVPNTEPLYIKKTENGVDFSEKKIIDDILISPVYVMQKDFFQMENLNLCDYIYASVFLEFCRYWHAITIP